MDKITYAFIDSQNLNLSIRRMGWKIDLRRLRIFMKDKFGVKNAYLFVGYIPGNQKLYTEMQKAGYIIIFKPTLFANGVVKGNCDAELVLHTMIEKEHFDNALIISGDGDFYCLIEYLVQQEKLLKVGIPDRKRYSSLLMPFRTPYFFYISDLRQKLEYKKRGEEGQKDKT